MLDVRDTNHCRLSVHLEPRARRILVFAAIDNLWKGAASQAVQNLNLMLGRPESEGAAVSAFHSRWTELPAHVAEGPDDGALPAGFRAAGVACGIKPSGGLDVGVLISDPNETTSAARFTRSGVLAAPVVVTQERARLDRLRAVVANAGNANAATGPAGLDVAIRMQAALGLPPDEVAVASTGVIGVPLDPDRVERGIAGALAALGPDGGEDFAAAIRTTDAFPKHASLEVAAAVGPRPAERPGQGRGDDLARLRHAAVLRADRRRTRARDGRPAARRLRQALLRARLGRRAALHQRHDRPAGQRGERGGGRARVRRRAAPRRGARRPAAPAGAAGRPRRRGRRPRRPRRASTAAHQPTVERVARAVADSPLVKAALHGGDPNWGRVAQAAGAALPGTAPLGLDVWIEDVRVCAAGAAVPHDEVALAAAVAGPEVEYTVALPGEGAEAELFFSDLSHQYVTINAEYTT